MSTEIIRLPRPTKIELIRLRRRLALTRRIHRILRDRLTFLMQEFYIALRKAYETRKKLNQLLSEIYKVYSSALAIYGPNILREEAQTITGNITIIAGTRNVMGVITPSIEILDIPQHTDALPLEVLEIQLKRRELIETIAMLSEYEKELIELGKEINRIRRIVIMLEKVLIPRLLNTIRYLMMKFDEIEREEKIRSIKIKTLILQRYERA